MAEYLNIKTIIETFSQNAVGGMKVPHGVSNPVFRKDESGSYVASAFVFFYNAGELRSRKVKRPSKWMTLDLKTGAIIDKFECAQHDFCTNPCESMCDLNPETDTEFSAEYINQTLAIFDLILKKYLIKGVFDKELNDAYMHMMLKMVSVGFKDYYKELNNI